MESTPRSRPRNPETSLPSSAPGRTGEEMDALRRFVESCRIEFRRIQSLRGGRRMTSEEITAQFPVLTDDQMAVVVRRGTRQVTTSGEVLYHAGDRGYDFIVIEAGEVDVVLPAMPNTPETLIATWGRVVSSGNSTC